MKNSLLITGSSLFANFTNYDRQTKIDSALLPQKNNNDDIAMTETYTDNPSQIDIKTQNQFLSGIKVNLTKSRENDISRN